MDRYTPITVPHCDINYQAKPIKDSVERHALSAFVIIFGSAFETITESILELNIFLERSKQGYVLKGKQLRACFGV